MIAVIECMTFNDKRKKIDNTSTYHVLMWFEFNPKYLPMFDTPGKMKKTKENHFT